jgi:tetratricopeptide (TPR) repeat protein
MREPPARIFVGRARELGEIRAGLVEAEAGRGQLFLIEGEPGIGKTCLADRIAGEAAARGATVAWGRCWESGGAPTLWPWVQVLRRLLAVGDARDLVLGSDVGAQVALLIPELDEPPSALPSSPAPSPLASEGERFRLFDALGRVMVAASRRMPVMLVLDDLHAADRPTLLLLRFIAREVVHGAALLVVGIYRSAEARRSADTNAVLAEVAREGRHVPLTGLSESEVAQFIAQSAGEPADPTLASAVHQATDGNPLFVDEVVRLLLASPRPEGLSSAIEIPYGVRQAVIRRLRALSAPCQETLAVAAVIGRDFDLAALEGAAGRARRELGPLIDEALDAGLVVAASTTPGRYAFSHALVHQALYGELPESDRARRHRRVGEAIEALGVSQVEARVAELAHHFLEASRDGDARKAVEYSRRAGDRALACLAYEDAMLHYDRAVGALGAGLADEPLRCRLLLALGHAENRAGAYDRARGHFREAADIARRLGLTAELATAALGSGGSGTRAGRVDADLVALLEETLGRLTPADIVLRASLLARLSVELYWSGDQRRCEALAREAVDLARRSNDRHVLGNALSSLHWALLRPEHVEARLELATEMVRIGEELRDPETILGGRRYRVIALLEVGDVAAADLEIDALAHEAEKYRAAFHLWYAPLFRATRALMDGRFDVAPRLMEEALAVGQRINNPDVLQFYGIQTFALLRELGRLGEIASVVESLAQENPAIPAWRCAVAYLHAELGDLPLARSVLERLAADEFAVLPRDVNWMCALAMLAETCAILGDGGVAASLYALLLPFEHHNVVVGAGAGSHAPAAFFLGTLALTMRRPEDALRHLETARAMIRRMGSRPAGARVALASAQAHLDRGAAGDREQAAPLAQHALETARALGMRGVAERAAALSARLTGEPPAAAGVGTKEARRSPEMAGPVLRQEGEYWVAFFHGDVVHVREGRGIVYLATLLANPGQEVPALDLVADLRAGVLLEGDTGPVVDGQAREAYRRRLTELRADLDEAEAGNDPGRVARAREEMESLLQELSRAIGLGGRGRTSGSAAERARQSVTRALQRVLGTLAKASPALGEHLAHSVRTGTFCAYEPDPLSGIRWTVETRRPRRS